MECPGEVETPVLDSMMKIIESTKGPNQSILTVVIARKRNPHATKKGMFIELRPSFGRRISRPAKTYIQAANMTTYAPSTTRNVSTLV